MINIEMYDTKLKELGESKQQLGMTWDDISDILNNEFGLHYSESFYRKRYGVLCCQSTPVIVDLSDSLSKKVLDSDTVTQLNAYIRRVAREESIKDIAKSLCDTLSFEDDLITQPRLYDVSDTCGLLLLSDWHYGYDFSFGKYVYSPDICKNRLEQLASEIINRYKDVFSTLYIFNLGDLIAGNIHLQIRIESRFDVVTQVLKATRLMIQFVRTLSEHFNIKFYSSLDNHSRLDPNKKESLQLENLNRVTHESMHIAFDNFNRVDIVDNITCEDIIEADINGWSIKGVHGDMDTINSASKNISAFLKSNTNLMVMAHGHHFCGDEQNCSYVIMNPSLVGVDVHSKDLRVSSNPCQLLIEVTKDRVVDAIHPITLN